MMKKLIKKPLFFTYFGILSRFLALVFSFLSAGVVYAVSAPRGWGETAQGFMGPVEILTDFMVNACIVIGFTFLFSALLKYRQHRINPMHVPISTVVFLVIISLIMLSLPLAPVLLDYLEHAGAASA